MTGVARATGGLRVGALASQLRLADFRSTTVAATCLGQAAGLVAAAGGQRGSVGEQGSWFKPSAGSDGSAAYNRLAKICGRFKSRAGANDAIGAEYFYRSYIQEGGEPQGWMFNMLLGTYGRLRQADKAWAIYQHLRQSGSGGLAAGKAQARGEAVAPAAGQAAAQQARQAEQQASEQAAKQRQQQQQQASEQAAKQQQQQRQQQASEQAAKRQQQQQQQHAVQQRDRQTAQQPKGLGGQAAPQAAGRQPVQQQQQGLGEEGRAAAWQARMEQRRVQLQAEAARLVRELKLDAVPLDEYAYGALITALSRAEHPPYDLPAHYAAKSAEAFSDMRAGGVQPNVVLWHNLMDSQAKACQVEAAFATYRAMLASGARPTSWTFSILVSACGRDRQPQRAAEVVERMMPQAGVTPGLPVWNALLGAYGRAGSVDAAYAVWARMLESGAIPDDFTERVLALAFASHPSLAADVVAEARQIRQQRQHEADSLAAAAAAVQARLAEKDREEGGAQVGDGDGEVAAGASVDGTPTEEVGRGERANRRPYRLHQHRQSPLAIEQHVVGRGWEGRTPMAQLLGAFQGAESGDSGACSASEEEERALKLRQLLVLDLHGSSQAAARMVLLHRLEALVLQAPQLLAEVGRREEEWQRRVEAQKVRREQARQQGELHRQQQAVAADALSALEGGAGEGGSSTSSGSHGGSKGRTGSASRRAKGGAAQQQQQEQQKQQQPKQQQHKQQQQQQLQQQQQQNEQPDSELDCEWTAAEVAAAHWPQLGLAWEHEHAEKAGTGAPGRAPAAGAALFAPAGMAGTQEGQQQQRQEACNRFLPPPLCVITGMGRHSRGGGVLKAAVCEVLLQQGLPLVEDPNNDGVVIVPWGPLAAYLQQQRQAMHTDHFLSAARMRYLFVFAGAAGIVAAANLLPRLAPWMA